MALEIKCIASQILYEQPIDTRVASEDLAYGLMRMYEVHRGRDLNETMVFRSFDEAFSRLQRLAG